MRRSVVLALALLTSACASGGPGTPTIGTDGGTTQQIGTPCARAKQIADDCKTRQGDSGVEIEFDQAKCESSGAQGEAAAQCIINNSSNCDCLLACALKQTCP
jgi:hypothetical protein